jgi:hypothetical protein
MAGSAASGIAGLKRRQGERLWLRRAGLIGILHEITL